MNDAERQTCEEISPKSPLSKRLAGKWLVLAASAAIGIAVAGVAARSINEDRLERWTGVQSIPTVKIISPKLGGATQELELPGDIQALFEAPIHARVSGYVRDWRYDIGARVKAGDVLATIEAPEIIAQFEQAKGELAKSQANLQIARVTSRRWSALRAPKAVSQQSVDEKESDVSAKEAEVASAKANVDRLSALKGFTEVVAPFDGIVTARNVDIGALVSGESGIGKELFRIADVHNVRVYVRVPQIFASQLRTGETALLRLLQYPDRKFKAKIVATSNSISKESRTLLVQLLADNPEEYLLPGSFVEVRFGLPPNPQILRAPVTALLFRGARIRLATLGPDGKVLLKSVEVARDLGSEVEISGIDPQSRIIDNPAESFEDGDSVRVVENAYADSRSLAFEKREPKRTSK
jgi:RND family efflux transporter MFP subunit